MRCVGPNQARYVRKEAHFGSCEEHAGPRTIAQKVARLGYYWPTMYNDATKVVSACANCQEHAPIMRKPQCDMFSISSPWPFYQWGIYLVGQFPEAPGRVKFLVVAIDYFTKWVEAAPLATITRKNILKFVWNNIVCHFGIPGVIIRDNGKQFAKNPLRDCQVYGSEAVLPPKISLLTYRVHSYDEYQNTKDLRLNLDLLEERMDIAALREARYKQHMEQYYNSKVHNTYLKVGDFVLRKNEGSRQEGQRKLDPN
ncbi:reverse transcriptase domain-containing protein [Tanacetum coccineum]